MRQLHNRIAAAGLLWALASPLPAVADVPAALCGSGGCEYLVQSFAGEYPDKNERKYWQCFNRATKVSIACAKVRGTDILKYSDVYRPRDTSNVIREDTLCMLRGDLNCDDVK